MDQWSKNMHAVVAELTKRGALPLKRTEPPPNAHPGRDAIIAAESVTDILAGPTDTLEAMSAKWAAALGLSNV